MRYGMWIALAVAILCGVLHASEVDEIPRAELDDPTVRLLVCTPEGPLIVQLSLTIDGRPYRYVAEDHLEQCFALVATPDGGLPSGDSVLAHPKVRRDWFAGLDVTKNRDALIAQFDGDRDGRASRCELRAVLVRQIGGEVLRVLSGPLPLNPDGQLFAVIDEDGDGRLSRDEIEQAPERIAKLDFSGNEVVTLDELLKVRGQKPARTPPVGVLVGRGLDPGHAIESLRFHYADATGRISRGAFQVVPEMFDRLDADRDGSLSDVELARVGSLTAHIMLANDQLNEKARDPELLLKGMSPGLLADKVEGAHSASSHRWRLGESGLEIHGL
ncbi:MAG TPA: hypothetical protein VHB77_05780, partial [Planctomycetaceae bacterium]|nr:hypothetical protein [Planctomycetaceae bacterium]